MRGEEEVGASPSVEDLFAFDLCCLAYQVYNQSLIWPLTRSMRSGRGRGRVGDPTPCNWCTKR